MDLGEGSTNPHDVAICSDLLFVSLYEKTEILVYSIEELSLQNRIDISAHADSDGHTEASSLEVLDDKLYVALQGLNRDQGFTPVGSTLLEVDCGTQIVSQSWRLGNNITLLKDPSQEQLYFSTQAWPDDDISAGIYSFSIEDGTDTPLFTIAEGTMAKASIVDKQLAMITTTPDYGAYQLHCYDIEEDTHVQSPPKTEYLTDVEVLPSGDIWLSAHWGWNDINNAKPGVYRTDMATCTLDEPQFNLSLGAMDMVYIGSY